MTKNKVAPSSFSVTVVVIGATFSQKSDSEFPPARFTICNINLRDDVTFGFT